MKNYTAFLRHDKGAVKVSVWANDRDSAKKQIMEMEKCPERSIEFIGVTPSKKEVSSHE